MRKNPLLKLSLLLLLSLTFLTSACKDETDTKANKSSKQPEICIFIYKKDDIYISMVRDSLIKEFGDKVNLSILYAEGDQFIQKTQIDEYLEEGTDLLIVNLVDTQSGAGVLDSIKKYNKPVIFFNREPDLGLLKSYEKSCFIGTKAQDAGVLQGQIINNIWRKHPEYDRNKDGKFQYIMFQGNPDNPEAIIRTEYSIKEAIRLGVPMEQLGETYVCDWNEDIAYQSMELAMGMHSDKIELVIANNDSMALGAIKALQQNSFNIGSDSEKHLPVVGVDAIPQAIVAINEGIMTATVKQDAEAMGKAIVELSFNIIEDKSFLEGTPYQWDETGIAVRIPHLPFSLE